MATPVQEFDPPQKSGSVRPMLDKRTVMRVVDRGVATGELQHACVHVPAHGEVQPEAIYVVLNKGIDLEGDAALVRRVRHPQQALHCTWQYMYTVI